jgi:hypothetical protein
MATPGDLNLSNVSKISERENTNEKIDFKLIILICNWFLI